jgi:hypothetical protein
MKISLPARLCIAVVAMFVIACSGVAESSANQNFTLVGSTACDAPIKSALRIPAETKCDFIRWNLILDPGKGNSFTLDASYGENQPNTTGFVNGGAKLSAGGKFEIAVSPRREVYRLVSAKPSLELSLLKIDANLFHLLMPDGSTMIGNGGWSYTLNRSVPLATTSTPRVPLPSPGKLATIVFDGRTPCRGLGAILDVRESSECFKLKWRITLNRDPSTLRPTTFSIRGVAPSTERTREIVGKWSETKLPDADATMIRLTPDSGTAGVALLAVDDNILFFLDNNGRPLVGDKDFSFTLNRRPNG